MRSGEKNIASGKRPSPPQSRLLSSLQPIILVVLAVKVKKGDYNGDDMNGMESGASYWHMVDLVWLVLFPMLYVLA